MTKSNSLSLAVLTGIIVMAIASPSSAAELLSISRSNFKNLKNSRVWEAQVQCSSSQEVILIRKSVGTELWCDARDSNSCEDTKNAIGQRLCEQNNAQVLLPSKSELVNEKMRIDEEQLAIEQRKLVLRREELVLQKRALELSEAN